MDLPGIVTSNLEIIGSIGTVVFGAYAVKIKIAHGKVVKAIKELEDIQETVVEAIADQKITTEEAEKIGTEVKEAIEATHSAADSVMVVIPKFIRSKIPLLKK